MNFENELIVFLLILYIQLIESYFIFKNFNIILAFLSYFNKINEFLSRWRNVNKFIDRNIVIFT